MRSLRAEGMARVRNNLMEHANKKGGTSVFSFLVSDAAGLRLRPVSEVGSESPYLDEGILSNAQEFRDSLEETFRAALAA
jgi:hypothetical protein